METSGDKESRAHQYSGDTPEHRKRAAAGETIQVCLVFVHYDQDPEDREAE
jgi:hypothetical protein